MKAFCATRAHKGATVATCLSMLTLVGASVRLQAAPASNTSPLKGSIPSAVAQSRAVSRLAAPQTLALALTLPLRNQPELTDLLQRLYDPQDPLHGQFLTAEEFAARFGPTQAEYDRVIAYARASGLTITGLHPNRTILDVTGTASQVEQAFNTRLLIYQSSTNGRYFYAPGAEPAVPASVASLVTGVVGLNNAAVWQTHHRILAPTSDTLQGKLQPFVLPLETGSGPGGGMRPSDIKTAYGLGGTSLTGSGQSLALFELANYRVRDITTYESYFGLPNIPLQNVIVGSGITSNGADEVTLDIELQAALAPGANKIYVYEGPNSDAGVINTYNKIATDNLAKQISTSWGAPESSNTPSTLNAENAAFQQMAAQGQSIFAASGDSGAYDDGSNVGVDDPASQPYMTGVGGTALATNGAGGSYKSETTWNGGSVGAGAGGGGISSIWGIPPYQTAAAAATSAASPAAAVSTTMRNVPDVSLAADPNTGYSIYYGGWNIYGGTSCAAPLWSAFTALVNQQRAASGFPSIGFFNPAIYTIAKGSRYGTDFHDIADGSTNLYYPAVVGYDAATGLGTFNGANLLADLVNAIPISGSVSLQGVASGNLSQALTITITPTGQTKGSVTVQTVTSASDGSFTLSGVPAGTYMLGIKGAKWLRKDVTVDTTGGSITLPTVPLLGGDLDGNNQVDFGDFLILRAGYNAVGTDLPADIDCNGQVDFGDFLILRANYNAIGNP